MSRLRLGRLAGAAAMLLAPSLALAAPPGHPGGVHAGGGSHPGGVHAGAPQVGAPHAGAPHFGAAHIGGVRAGPSYPHPGGVYSSGVVQGRHPGGVSAWDLYRGGNYGTYYGGYRGGYPGGLGLAISLGGYYGGNLPYGSYGYAIPPAYWSPGVVGTYSPVTPSLAGSLAAPALSAYPRLADDLAVPADVPVRPPAPAAPAASEPAPADTTAHVEVRVPPGAEVWFGSTKTKTTGMVREFVSPPLTPGRDYSYEIRARWTEGGREVVQTRRITVSAGAWRTVDLTKPSAETVPSPQPARP